MSVALAAPPPGSDDVAGRRFDAAMRHAEHWRWEATLYRGERREIRLRHALRMEQIAERMVEDA